MFITNREYKSNISKAYTRGVKQGFELACKLKQNHEFKNQDHSFLLDSSTSNQLNNSSLKSQRLIDMARDIFDIPRNRGSNEG